jgi:hypothetical protein
MTPPTGRRTTQPACDDCEKTRLEKQLAAEEAARAYERDVAKAEAAALAALHQAERNAELELNKAFHATVAEVAKGAIERSRDSAKYVQTAAAAIGTLYSGLLALVFSVTDNPLPLRGVWAAMFLGLAVALSTAYLAYLTKPTAPAMYGGGSSLADLQFQRTGWLTRWINSTVLNRRWAIRASVLALAFGVAFVPAPFVSTARTPDVPAAPVAPAIPGTVAPAVAADAARLFAAQVTGFEAAVDARAAALAAQAEAAKDAAADERLVEWAFVVAAALALAATLLGPHVWRHKDHPSAPGSAVEAAPAAAGIDAPPGE